MKEKEEVIEVVYCRKSSKTQNRQVANLFKKELLRKGKTCKLKSFSELSTMALHLKIVNPSALGIIAFRSMGKIMSEGIDVIAKNKLYIKNAFRMHTKKDYFVVLSHPPKAIKPREEDWRTLVIAEEISYKDLALIDKLISKSGLDSQNFESRLDKKKFYIEIQCHSSCLKSLLEELEGADIKAIIVGTYQIKPKINKMKKGENKE